MAEHDAVQPADAAEALQAGSKLELPDRVSLLEQQIRTMNDILVLGEIPYTPEKPPSDRWLIHARGGVLYVTDDAGTHHKLSGAITDHGGLSGLNDNDHGAIYYTEAEVNALLTHTAASHSDQGATGAELEELTDASVTTLHSHAGGGGGMTTIVKAVDESLTNNIIVQNDDTLFFAVEANKKYIFECLMIVNSSSSPDFRWTFTGPSGSKGSWGSVSHSTPSTADPIGQEEVLTLSAWPAEIHVLGGIANGANAGNLQLKWCQNTNSGSATKVLAGSYILWSLDG